jgi:hypothetical protein
MKFILLFWLSGAHNQKTKDENENVCEKKKLNLVPSYILQERIDPPSPIQTTEEK